MMMMMTMMMTRIMTMTISMTNSMTITNLPDMQETSLATLIADSFLTKSVESFL